MISKPIFCVENLSKSNQFIRIDTLKYALGGKKTRIFERLFLWSATQLFLSAFLLSIFEICSSFQLYNRDIIHYSIELFVHIHSIDTRHVVEEKNPMAMKNTTHHPDLIIIYERISVKLSFVLKNKQPFLTTVTRLNVILLC